MSIVKKNSSDDRIHDFNQHIKKNISKAEKFTNSGKYDDAIKYYSRVIGFIATKNGTANKEVDPSKLSKEDRGYYFDAALKTALVYANKNNKQNNKKSAQLYFNICSTSGMPDIYYKLGKECLNSNSVLKNTESAKHYLSLAASQGNKEAKETLHQITDSKKSLARQKENFSTKIKTRDSSIDLITNQGVPSPQLASSCTSITDIIDENYINDDDEWMVQNFDYIYNSANNNKKDKNSQFTLGYLYENGKGVEKNIDSAVKWYLEAKKNGHVGAYCNLGYIYETHNGYDKTKAFKLYQHAAQRDCVQAQYNLASCLDRGVGVSKNSEMAIHWFKRAANGNHHEAEANLGYIYWKKKNYSTALDYYRKAAKFGIVRAQFALGYIYDVEKINKEDAIGKNSGLAEHWYKICNKQGHLDAINNLGYFYEKNDRIEDAIYYYNKAIDIDKEYFPALNNLGLLYFYNEGVKDHLKAEELLYEAKSMGSELAAENLKYLKIENNSKRRFSTNKDSSTYVIKETLKQDFKQAYRFFEELADNQTNPIGWYELGLLYQYARPGIPDYEKILQHYFNAKDNPAALYKLASMYYLADGVNRDLDQAIAYLEKVKVVPIQKDSRFICPIRNDLNSNNDRDITFCLKTSNELLAEMYCVLGYLYEHKGDHINMIKYLLMSSYLGCNEAKREVKEIINQQTLVSLNKD